MPITNPDGPILKIGVAGSFFEVDGKYYQCGSCGYIMAAGVLRMWDSLSNNGNQPFVNAPVAKVINGDVMEYFGNESAIKAWLADNFFFDAGSESVNADWNATSGPAQILNRPDVWRVGGNNYTGTRDIGSLDTGDVRFIYNGTSYGRLSFGNVALGPDAYNGNFYNTNISHGSAIYGINNITIGGSGTYVYSDQSISIGNGLDIRNIGGFSMKDGTNTMPLLYMRTEEDYEWLTRFIGGYKFRTSAAVNSGVQITAAGKVRMFDMPHYSTPEDAVDEADYTLYYDDNGFVRIKIPES